jgi:hypothetical protein
MDVDNDAMDVQQMAENIVGRTTFDGYKLAILEISAWAWESQDKDGWFTEDYLADYKEVFFGAEEWDFLNAIVGKWNMDFGREDENWEEKMTDFDLVVIGSSPGGESLALSVARLEKKVTLVEQAKQFGGPTGLGSKAFREAALKVLSWTKLKDSRPTPETVQAIFNSRFVTFRDYAVTLVSHELMCRL